MSEGSKAPVEVVIVGNKTKKRAGKVVTAIVTLLAIVTGVISIIQYVSGEEYLLGLFRVKPTNAHGYEVGDTIPFGKWDWLVLDVQDDKALLITKDIIEMRPYNIQDTAVTWETCTLRAYLNDEAYKNFSEQEQAMILETMLDNAANQWYGIYGGNATMDRIFLLSIEEVVKYFGDSGDLSQRKGWKYESDQMASKDGEGVINDQYNIERAAVYGNDAAGWWLRSPGRISSQAASIGGEGYLRMNGNRVNRNEDDDDIVVGLRPALWLKLT